MNQCHFCQDDIEVSKAFHMTAPDKTEAYICPDCMADVLKFFKSGEADKANLEEGEPKEMIKVWDGIFDTPLLDPYSNAQSHFERNRFNLEYLLGVTSRMQFVAIDHKGRTVSVPFKNARIDRYDINSYGGYPKTELTVSMLGKMQVVP